MTFRLQPYFYQRRSVHLALVVFGLAIVAGVVRGYVHRTRRRAHDLERVVAVRTRELSDAHERLGAAHEDVVESKHIVEQAHNQLLALLNQLDVGALVLGTDGSVRYASASAERVLRKDQRSMVGQPWPVCLSLVDSDRVAIKARFERPSPSGQRVPVQMQVADTRYWAEIQVCEEPPPGNGRILYIHNVTEVAVHPSSGSHDVAYGIVGRSTATQVVLRQIRDVARVDSTVLVQGETGVGKELVARAIHDASRRAGKPFVAFNAAGLTESLLASQLFGHRRGAFTGAVDEQKGFFEAADGGTLFLDEIGDMPPSVQASLLRVLQEREIMRLGESRTRRVDVRFLAATHHDLARETGEGRFREDLFYRIRVATITVPPLRARMEDIPLLVRTFLESAAKDARRGVPAVSREVVEALCQHDWPGNVRELKAVIEQTLVNTWGDIVLVEHLPLHLTGQPTGHLPLALGRDERERIIAALRRAKGNRAEAARLLGIGRTTLYRRLRDYALDEDAIASGEPSI